MQKNDPILLLNEKIAEIEKNRSAEGVLLKVQFRAAMESLKPINLLKETFSSPKLDGNLVDTAIGITTGFITKKVIAGSSKNSLVKILASVIGTAVGNLAAKHPGGIKNAGSFILNILSPKDTVKEESANGDHR